MIDEGKRDKVVGQSSDDFFVHALAAIDDGVEIGKGTRIWHFSHVLKNSRIG